MTSYATSATCTGTGVDSQLSEYCQQVTTYPVGDNNHLVSFLDNLFALYCVVLIIGILSQVNLDAVFLLCFIFEYFAFFTLLFQASVWTGSDEIKTGYTFDDGYLYFNFYQVQSRIALLIFLWA